MVSVLIATGKMGYYVYWWKGFTLQRVTNDHVEITCCSLIYFPSCIYLHGHCHSQSTGQWLTLGHWYVLCV